jgi:hypothetical protein
VWSVYAVVAAAWLATRVIALVSVDLTPWMLNDLDIYAAWLPHLQAGAFPVGDPTWQYPPGSAPVFLLAGLVPADFRWSFTVVVLAADAAIMAALIVAHVRRPGASWRGLWLWAFAGVVVGPIMLVRFDLVPTLFAVTAVLLVARPALSGMSAALGLTVKVWPALMLFVLPRRSLPRGLLGFAATAAVVLIAFALVTDSSLSFLGNQQARGLQVESIGALPYELYSLAGGHVTFGHKYGSIQVLMQGAEAIGLLLTLIGLSLFGALAWARLSGRLDAVPPGDVAMAVMLVAVATSRVYSPQFNVWLVGMAAVAMIDAASRQRDAVGLVIVVSVLTQVVYPWSATQLVTGGPIAIAAQSLRIAGLITALVLSLRAVLLAHRTALGPSA